MLSIFGTPLAITPDMKTLPPPGSTETKNITFRTYAVYETAVQRAADKAGKNLSDYCRDIIVAWAYSDLGERMPQLPPITRGRYTSIVREAASMSGLSQEEFIKRAARDVAAQMIESNRPAKLTESGERPAVRPGAYARRV